MSYITEADAEQAAVSWLEGVGWQVAHGPDIATTLRSDALSSCNQTFPNIAIGRSISPNPPRDGLGDSP